MYIDKDLMDLLQKRCNLPKSVIEDIIKYPFKFVAECIKEGEPKDILLNRFGRFSVNQNKLKHFKRHGKVLIKQSSNDS